MRRNPSIFDNNKFNTYTSNNNGPGFGGVKLSKYFQIPGKPNFKRNQEEEKQIRVPLRQIDVDTNREPEGRKLTNFDEKRFLDDEEFAPKGKLAFENKKTLSNTDLEVPKGLKYDDYFTKKREELQELILRDNAAIKIDDLFISQEMRNIFGNCSTASDRKYQSTLSAKDDKTPFLRAAVNVPKGPHVELEKKVEIRDPLPQNQVPEIQESKQNFENKSCIGTEEQAAALLGYQQFHAPKATEHVSVDTSLLDAEFIRKCLFLKHILNMVEVPQDFTIPLRENDQPRKDNQTEKEKYQKEKENHQTGSQNRLKEYHLKAKENHLKQEENHRKDNEKNLKQAVRSKPTIAANQGAGDRSSNASQNPLFKEHAKFTQLFEYQVTPEKNNVKAGNITKLAEND